MKLDEQIKAAGSNVRDIAKRRQDAAEQHGTASEAFAALDAEYKAALDALAKLTAEQFKATRALKRASNPWHGITKG